MAIVSSNFSVSHRAEVAEYRRHAYFADGWRKVKRYDGRSAAMTLAGITGPSQDLDSWQPVPVEAAGALTVGLHVVRYRYLDSTTGYVSNPSEEREVAVTAGNGKLTFPIDAVPGGSNENMVRSTDPKVDKIVVEATVAGGTLFFKAAEVLQSANTVEIDVSDAFLETQFLPWPEDGHDPPPIAQVIVSFRQRIWLFGQVTHRAGSVDVVNGSDRVGSNAADWTEDALGTATTPATTTWLFQKDGDSRIYEVAYYDSALDELVLVEPYAGADASMAGYKLFNRSNVIWVSRAGFPESFIPLAFINGPNGERAGDLTAGVGYSSSMIFFALSGMWRLSWDVDPLSDPQIRPLSDKYGALSQRVVVDVEGVIYSMDNNGWQAWSGVFPRHISRPVDELLELIDFDLAKRFHAVFFPQLRAVRWYVCFSGETFPRHYVQYDVDTGDWSTGETQVGISDSRLVPTAEGVVVYLGDENGHLWIADRGTCDGCKPDYSHLTADAGATAAVIPVLETLTTDNVGIAGCVAYWADGPGGGEYSLIESNNAGSITVSGFSSAPAPGDRIWVGTILARLKSRAFTAPRAGTSRKTRGRYVWVSFEPIPRTNNLPRLGRFRAYRDYSATSSAWGDPSFRGNLPGLVRPGSPDPYPDGDLARVGVNDYLIDFSRQEGVVRVPVGGDYQRAVEFELVIDEPDFPLEVFELEYDGEETEGLA